MENYKKCSLEEEKEVNAICYCQECRIYMCNKCENTHSKLFKNYHHCFKLDKEINDLFTGFCQEKQHNEKLEYFCKEHNVLCCVSCICKIKGKGKGDEIPLKNSKGEMRKRDIVQFIKFNNFKKNNAINFGTDFAEEVLKEIPTQIEEYYNNVGKFY